MPSYSRRDFLIPPAPLPAFLAWPSLGREQSDAPNPGGYRAIGHEEEPLPQQALRNGGTYPILGIGQRGMEERVSVFCFFLLSVQLAGAAEVCRLRRCSRNCAGSVEGDRGAGVSGVAGRTGEVRKNGRLGTFLRCRAGSASFASYCCAVLF